MVIAIEEFRQVRAEGTHNRTLWILPLGVELRAAPEKVMTTSRFRTARESAAEAFGTDPSTAPQLADRSRSGMRAANPPDARTSGKAVPTENSAHRSILLRRE